VGPFLCSNSRLRAEAAENAEKIKKKKKPEGKGPACRLAGCTDYGITQITAIEASGSLLICVIP
jgi:hypothetical protein